MDELTASPDGGAVRRFPLALPAVAVAAALFGASGTIAELGPDDLPAFTAGLWRAVIGAIGLTTIAVVSGAAPWRYPVPRVSVVIAGIAVVVNQTTFFEAVDRTGVAVGTLVTIGTGPVVAGLLDSVLNRRRPGRFWMLGSAIAIAGVAALTSGTADVDAAGIGLALAAGASFPVYGLVAQRLMQTRPPVAAMATVFGAGAVLLAPMAAASVTDVAGDAGATSTVVVLGILTVAVPYTLWGFALKHLTLSVVVTATLIEPAMASILAVTVLGEDATITLAVGLVLVALGVVIAGRQRTLPVRR